MAVGKARRKTFRFGLAGGRHMTKRKIIHQNAGRKAQDRYSCTLNMSSSGIKLKFRKLKDTRPKTNFSNAYQLYKHAQTNRLRKRPVKQLFHDLHQPNGYRFMNLHMLEKHVSEISMHSAVCNDARELSLSGISPIKLSAEISTFGLASVFSITCKGCGKDFLFQTSPRLEINKSNHFDINVRAVWGTLVTGNGNAHLNEFMATCNAPGLGQNSFQSIEREINMWWRDILQKDVENAIEEEKRIAISKGSFYQGIPAVTVVCDGGWGKRSHKHSYNALGGVAIIIGAATQKVLHIGIRNKHCIICSRAETDGRNTKEHDCFKNWTESSQSMEADIIVEGFLKANDYGIRYMKIIGDGDSSVFANIREKVPVWGSHVEKLECANHVCKCLRENLEKLVDDNPSYKGKGKLTKNIRIRIVTAVRCAIRMRSSEKDTKTAVKKLAHDIRNSVYHIYGDHSNCSKDFCKSKQQAQKDDDDSACTYDEQVEQDILLEQSNYWRDGSSLQEQEKSRGDSQLSSTDLSKCSKMKEDIVVILNRVADKSHRLIGNYTSNLAECWMHIRTKFDGGKVFNHCNRWSWHTRCYAGALRMNMGTQWPALSWEECTGTLPGTLFTDLYERRERSRITCNTSKAKPECTNKRWKKRRSIFKLNSTTKARQAYGPEALDSCPDVTPEELDKKVKEFMERKVHVSAEQIAAIEISTRQQVESDVWKVERKKRLTSSCFGQIVRRNTKISVAPLVRQIVYPTFKGNRATNIGLEKEGVTRDEYVAAKGGGNLKIQPSGFVIHPVHHFLGASPDGIVMENGEKKGLVELKNIIYNKPFDLSTAARLKNMKDFCLEFNNNKLQLKKAHKFFYQCQGLLGVTGFDWIDFVVRTETPYQLHIERIFKDEHLWEDVMVPKLHAFYHKAILPELACPRYKLDPGIREPGVWFDETISHSCSKRRRLSDSSSDAVDDINLPSTSTCRRHVCREHKTKFVGRRISHQWIVDEEKKTTEWYTGTVLQVLKGHDGSDDAVYEVQYDDDDDPFEVDHLIEDYKAQQVKFTDI